MIKFLNNENASKIWDNALLKLSNPTFYQCYNYSLFYKGDEELEYVYKTNSENEIEIMGFVKVCENEVKIPFGPIYKSNISLQEVMNFIDDVRNHYNKKVIFSLSRDIIDQKVLEKYNLVKGWFFETPLVDTDKPIEMIIKNCNENRRRIVKKVISAIPNESIKNGSVYIEEFLTLYKKRLNETHGELDVSLDDLNELIKYDNTNLIVCLNENKVIAGSFTFEFGDTLITRYNCFDSDYNHISPIARIDYELLKYASSNPNIKYFDMSGLSVGDDITQKESNINRYKLSYRPCKTLTYQWYEY